MKRRGFFRCALALVGLQAIERQPSVHQQSIDHIAYVLFLQTWLDSDEEVSDLSDERLVSYRAKWNEWLSGRYENHFGDCIKVPMTCHRCVMDELFRDAERLAKSATGVTFSCELRD